MVVFDFKNLFVVYFLALFNPRFVREVINLEGKLSFFVDVQNLFLVAGHNSFLVTYLNLIQNFPASEKHLVGINLQILTSLLSSAPDDVNVALKIFELKIPER